MAPHELGFWGKPTATIDWCETNYEVTHYVAEFWNTVSNLSMIIPPAWGAYFAWKDALGLRFVTCYLCLLIIGVGSWAFHMTLLYEMQLFDELPMLWGSCVILYCLVGILFPDMLRQSKIVILSLTFYALLVTVVYLAIKKPIFHEVAYAILVALIFALDVQLARTRKCDTRLLICGCSLYIVGFAVWNVDNVFCSRITSLRGELPNGVGPITQLHAWWHLFAGYSTYMNIMFCQQQSQMQNYAESVGWTQVRGKPSDFWIKAAFTCLQKWDKLRGIWPQMVHKEGPFLPASGSQQVARLPIICTNLAVRHLC